MKAIFLSILSAIAFVGGMGLADLTYADLEEQHQEAVDAGVITVVVAENEETAELSPPAPARNYFDVPLSHDVQNHIFTECEKYNISPAIIVAMIERESDFDTYNLGDDGRAAGLMQIQAKWHLKRMIQLDCTDLFDPYQNITVGIDYLAELLNRHDGDIAKALVAYNQGSYKGTITNYAKSILNNAEELK